MADIWQAKSGLDGKIKKNFQTVRKWVFCLVWLKIILFSNLGKILAAFEKVTHSCTKFMFYQGLILLPILKAHPKRAFCYLFYWVQEFPSNWIVNLQKYQKKFIIYWSHCIPQTNQLCQYVQYLYFLKTYNFTENLYLPIRTSKLYPTWRTEVISVQIAAKMFAPFLVCWNICMRDIVKMLAK